MPGGVTLANQDDTPQTFASSAGRVTNADREIFPTVVETQLIFHPVWRSDR